MNKLIEYIRFDFLKKELSDEYHYFSNSVFLSFDSVDKFILKDEIIDIFNTHYLPFYQNFDRIDD